MRKIMRLVFIILLSLSTQLLIGQGELFAAIGKADAEKLSQSFGKDVEICIGTDQDFYSKSGAIKKLNAFFDQVKPSSSSFKHKGSSKDKSSEYSVGSLTTERGKYRVFIYFEGDKVTGLHFNRI